MMKQVMVRAWEIARQGQEQFGGKVSEYLSQALKMAWAESKEVTYEVVLDLNSKDQWIARINGTHPTYKLNREFLNNYYVHNYFKVFDLTDGVYAAKFSNRGGQKFFQVVNGEAVEIDYTTAVELAKQMDQQEVAA